jgi:hypothetical protein
MRRGVLFDPNILSPSKIDDSYFLYFQGDIYRYKTNYIASSWVEFGSKMKEHPKDFHWFEDKRIVLRRLVNRQQRLMASLIDTTVITNKNLYIIKPIGDESIEYILGLLNSRLFSRLYLSQVSQATKDDFPQITITDILQLPIRTIDFSSPADVARHDRMVSLVNVMLALNRQLAAAKTAQDKTVIQRQIDATDSQIDRLVYELYGLTEEEIGIVEES